MHYLQEHQPFVNLNELNKVVAAHFDRCNYQLNETDRDVLVLLSRQKKKKMRNVFGYYDVVLRNLIDKAIFGNVFMEYDVAVEMVIPRL